MGHGTSIAMWQNKPAKNGDQGLAPTEAGHITILGLLIDFQLSSFYQYITISIYIYMHCFIDELDVIVWYVFCIYTQNMYMYVYIYIWICICILLLDWWIWCVCTYVYIYIYAQYIYICYLQKQNIPYKTIHISIQHVCIYILYSICPLMFSKTGQARTGHTSSLGRFL
jgi:hypothetical protein